jgi:hypothetical protein
MRGGRVAEDEVLTTLRRLRDHTDDYYSTTEVRREMRASGLFPPGYARVHYSLMMLAKYGFIEVEPTQKNLFREWVRRFRAKEKATVRPLKEPRKEID